MNKGVYNDLNGNYNYMNYMVYIYNCNITMELFCLSKLYQPQIEYRVICASVCSTFIYTSGSQLV